MKTNGNLISRVRQRLENAANEISCSNIMISSDRELILSGCIGLKEYSNERVVLEALDLRAVILGKEFELKSFATGEICVLGRIESLCLESHKRGEENVKA